MNEEIEKYLNAMPENFMDEIEEDKRDFNKILDPNNQKLKNSYNLLIKILKKYLDLKEEYYKIIAIWILGTYIHKKFATYPYLFLNAMKGSGKTRTLKLITTLSWNGELQNNLSEAVLFRTAEQHTIGIDELEHIASKEKSALREFLNSAYKAGIIVKRVYKIKGKEREEYKTEEFRLYCPVVMANIWGMDEVLGDRCLSLILEKSDKSYITRKVEIFDQDDDIITFKSTLVTLVYDTMLKNNIYSDWNNYLDTVNNRVTSGVSVISRSSVTSGINNIELLEKVFNTSLDGRYLELFFPLFIIAYQIGNLDEVITIAEEMIKEKKEDDVAEGRDVSFLSFIINHEEINDFVSIAKLANEFKGDGEEQWITSDWVGRSLRRLNLVIDKRRVGKGREVMINFKKAKEKGKMFGIQNKDAINEEKI